MVQVKKPVPTLDEQLRMLERFMPAGYTRGARGGIPTLHPVSGKVLDADGAEVSGGGGVSDLVDADLTGTPTADTAATAAAGREIVNAEWIRQHRLTLNNAPAGYVHPYKCPGGVQPERAQLTTRTDVYIRYEMPTQPASGGVWAIVGDEWTRRSWPEDVAG